MSEFDNLYLCPKCDYVGSITDDKLECEKCSHQGCYVARHINEGTRKFWIRKEQNSSGWRFEKKIATMYKDGLPDDKNMIKQFQKIVKHIFSQFGQHKDDLENIFPQFIRDYKRTTGRRERGWRKNISAAKQVRNSLRGMIYEGAVNHFTNNLENFEQVRLPIPYVDKNGKDREFEPDYWFNFNGYKIPVELKTYDKGRMAPATIKKGIKQSRKYGNLSVAGNPHKFSGIIVCNPEERLFSCIIMDENIERLI